MAIKGVLFDKDGTLIDVTGTWVPVYREVLAEVFADLAPQAIEAKFTAAGYDPEAGVSAPARSWRRARRATSSKCGGPILTKRASSRG